MTERLYANLGEDDVRGIIINLEEQEVYLEDEELFYQIIAFKKWMGKQNK